MTKNILLEGDITAADTFTPLTTRGSEATPSRQIPVEWSKLDRIVVAVAVDMTAAGSAVFILRLTGGAIQGTHDIIIGAAGGQEPQAGADRAPEIGLNHIIEDVDIPVNGGDVIDVQPAMTAPDPGPPRVVVSLYGA